MFLPHDLAYDPYIFLTNQTMKSELLSRQGVDIWGKNIVSEYDLHFIILVLENIKLFTDPQQIMLAPVGTLNNVRKLIFMQF